jgi:hypothetical protein
MLRLAVLLLVLANAAYFAWSQGHLVAWGVAPAQQSEPQRMEQQIRPQAVRLLAPDEAKRLDLVAAAGPKPAECLQAGLFEDAETTAVKQALDGWPSGSWSLEPTTEPARWIVYMGKYLTAENVNRKKAELRQRGVSFEPLSNAALEPGLSLGGFPTQAAATEHLQALAPKGVHTAKVVQERGEARGHLLKVASVDDALRGRLEELKPALGGKALRPCR